MDTILIAVDGSPASDVAARYGLELAAEHESRVTFALVVPAVDVVPAGGFGLTAALPHELSDSDRRPLDDALAWAEDAGIHAHARLLRGDPVDELVAFADTIDADLIVVGSRGHGALACARLGSVSRGILREARRPVLVVRGAAARKETATAAA